MGYFIEIYDQTSKGGNDPTGKLCIITNAFNKELTKELNGAGSFTFSLPFTDPNSQYLKELNHIKVFKDGVTLPIFDGRIMPYSKSMAEDGTIQADVTCEGFATTLTDKIWAGQVQFTNRRTDSFLGDVLAKQSGITGGTMEFGTGISVDFSYDNLMYMAYRVTSIVGGDMEVDANRKLNHWLQKGKDLGVRIEYGFNLKTIEVATDPTEMATRLYGLGTSEGVNQTTIKSVNGGIEYIDADTIGSYGVIERVLTDREITDPATLKLKMQTYLEQIKKPTKSFSISALNLAELTGYEHMTFDIGDSLYIRHVDLGVEEKVRIVSMTQNLDRPEEITLEISNRTKDISEFLAELKSKQETWERYPQGAMNIYCVNKEQNVDTAHPLILRFPMPPQIRNTARVLLGLRGIKFQEFSVVGGSSNVNTTLPNETTTTQSQDYTETRIHPITQLDKSSHAHHLTVHLVSTELATGKLTPALHPITGNITSTVQLNGIDPTYREGITDDFVLSITNTDGSHEHYMEHSHELVHVHGMQHSHPTSSSITDTTYPKDLTIKIDGKDYTSEITAKGFSRGDGGAITWDNFDLAPYLDYGNYVHTLEIGSSQNGRIDAWVIPQVLVASE